MSLIGNTLRSKLLIYHPRLFCFIGTILIFFTSFRLARDYGLHLLYKKEFHDIFDAEKDHKEYGPLLQRMKVVTADGESQMDEDQWEAASMSQIL